MLLSKAKKTEFFPSFIKAKAPLFLYKGGFYPLGRPTAINATSPNWTVFKNTEHCVEQFEIYRFQSVPYFFP